VLLPIVAVIVFLLDLWSKHFIVAHGDACNGREVIQGLLRCTLEENQHGAFGLFGSSPYVLVGLAIIVLAIFTYAFRDAVKNSRIVQVSFGMIVGGAIGNLVDRLQHHYVVDFIDFYRIWHFIFNLGDSAITVGVVLLIVSSMRSERKAAT